MNNKQKVKTPQHAAEVIKAMQDEYAKGVIKGYAMPPLMNTMTGQTIGFAVMMQVGTKFDYPDDLLHQWRDRFGADDYYIGVKRNQLWLTFNVRDFVPAEKHIAKMTHAIGLDHKQIEPGGLHKAYRNGSYYDAPDPLWDELERSGYANSVRREKDYRYHVTPKGFQFLAEHYKLMIRDTKEYEGRTER